MATKIGKLAAEVMKQLEVYGEAEGLIVDKVIDDVAKDTANNLTKNSPELTGDYAASWTYGYGQTKRTKHTKLVYADKPEYTLTHLLEKGHQNRNGGRTAPVVHIAPAQEMAAEELEEELKRRL